MQLDNEFRCPGLVVGWRGFVLDNDFHDGWVGRRRLPP
jgi:hypothetical protein